MRCSICKGVYHPTTGHMWSELVRLCGPCAHDWCTWLKLRMNHMNAKIKSRLTSVKISFADNAAKSIIGD